MINNFKKIKVKSLAIGTEYFSKISKINFYNTKGIFGFYNSTNFYQSLTKKHYKQSEFQIKDKERGGREGRNREDRGREGRGREDSGRNDKKLTTSVSRKVQSSLKYLEFPFHKKMSHLIKGIEQNENFLINIEMNQEVLLSNIFIGNTENLKDIVFIVENDEDANFILKLGERNYAKYPMVEIANASQLNLIKMKLAKYYIVNYKNFIDENNCELNFTPNKILCFYQIKENNLFSNWIQKQLNLLSEFTNVITINNNQHDSKLLLSNNKFDHLKINEFRFNPIEEDEIRNLSILNFGMCLEEKETEVAIENVKKFLHQKKKILVLFENQKEKDKFQNHFSELKNLTKLGENLVEIKTETELNNSFERQFDILIEVPFVNENSLLNRRVYLKQPIRHFSYMISLFNVKKNREFHELRKMNSNLKIKVTNLLSYSWLFNDFKTEDFQSDPQKDVEEDSLNYLFYSKLEENMKNSEKNLSDTQRLIFNQNFESLYNYISQNPFLLKNICKEYLQQNYYTFFKNTKENISLLTGKTGYYTVLITPLSSKQLEERYYIFKFLIKNKVINEYDTDKKILRVYQTFGYVCDIPCDIFSTVQKNAEEYELRLNILTELPILFFHQYSDVLYKSKKGELEDKN